LVEFFDDHDLGERWEDLPEAEFEVDLKRRTLLVSVDGTLAGRLSRLARAKHTSTEDLVNAWLAEKLEQTASH
jgi:hypothetical protein